MNGKSMMKKSLLLKETYREIPAKPATLRRRDYSQKLLDESCSVLGVSPDPRILIDLPTPDMNQSIDSFRRDYWAAEMWSKYPFELEGVNREQAAIARFREAESACASVNKRLADGWSKPLPEEMRALLKRARRSICRLIGDVSTDEVFAACGWGPGASTSLRRAKSSSQTKWDAATHVTTDASHALYHFKLFAGRDVGGESQVVSGNRVTTVPKNAKTDRIIAIEPDWNMFLQRGVGNVIRRRLNKVGLLVENPWRNSQALNRDLARFGSETNTFGTIDLRNASDSVSLALCELLLPQCLLGPLMGLRSPSGELPDGSTVTYEKISSMGNGATFELETLIFWGLSTAVDEAGAIVYGDDIIVPNREIGYRLIELLEFCGFEINRKKTFLDGPFRESCGGHYFAGVDVTPPYVRKALDSLPAIISAGNALTRANCLDYLPPLFADSWQGIKEEVPRRFRGPKSAGNVCLWSPFDACTPEWLPHLQCYAGFGLSGRVGRVRSPERGGLADALWSKPKQGASWESDHHDYYVISRWIAYPWIDG